jgi:MFS family permease
MMSWQSNRGVHAVVATYAREVRAFQAPARRFLTASILGGINAGVSSILLPLFLLATGAGEAELGRLISFSSVGAALGAVVGGPFADRWGPWRALVVGTVITGVGLVAVLVPAGAIGSGSVAGAILRVGLTLGGLGAVVVYLAVPPFLAAISPRATRPYLFGVAGATYVTSAAVGSLLGGALPTALRAASSGIDDATTYRLALIVGVACSGLGIPFLVSARPVAPTTSSRRPTPDRREDGTAKARVGPESFGAHVSLTVQAFVATWRDPIARDTTLRFLVTDGLLRLGGNMVVPFFNVYFMHELGASEAWYGTMRVVERAIEVVAMLGVAPIAARLGPVATIAWTQALSVPMLVGLGFAPGLYIASAVFVVRGTLMEMTVPLRDNLMMDRFPREARATGSAAVMLSGYALAFVGVRIGGALNEAGLRHVAYIVTAILYLGGAITFARVFRPGPRAEVVPNFRALRLDEVGGASENPSKGADGL